jgi:multiple sugar transport system permease protein
VPPSARVDSDPHAQANASASASARPSSIARISPASILIVSVLAGYAFSRLPFRGSRTIVVTLFRIMANLHLIDTQFGLVLVFAATQGPLAMWLAHNQCRELPPEPVEAALIDGCNQWQAFVKVALPQMRSGIAAMGAIFMLAVWGEFLIPCCWHRP